MTKNVQPISIIVPTLNEVGNIPLLFERIALTMNTAGIPYEIVIVDDHSTDGTLKLAIDNAVKYPLRVFLKKGKPGKAYSLLEGFAHAEHDIVCMIDADLQYPPEAIAPMFEQLQESAADLVITERVDQKTSFLRQLTSKGFNLVFTRALFGIHYDTQSGLKLFRKNILKSMTLTPSPWSFDLEFIVRALENDYKIMSYEIPFEERYAGEPKLHVVTTAVELAKASLKLHHAISVKQVKGSYKHNLEFTRSMVVSTIVGLSVVMAGMLGTQQANADKNIQDTQNTTDIVMQQINAPVKATQAYITSVISSLDGASTTPTSTQQQPTTTQKEPQTPGAVAAQSGALTKSDTQTSSKPVTNKSDQANVASATTGQGTTQATGSAAVLPASSYTSAAKLINPAAPTTNAVVVAPAAPNQTTVAHGMRAVNYYAPSPFSAQKKNQLTHVALLVLEIGAAFVVLNAIMMVVRILRAHKPVGV